MLVRSNPDGGQRLALHLAAALGVDQVDDPDMPTCLIEVDTRLAEIVPIRPEPISLLARLRDLAGAELLSEHPGEAFMLTPSGAGITADLVAVALTQAETLAGMRLTSVIDLIAYLQDEAGGA